MLTTAGQVLVNEALPDDLRDYGRSLDKKAYHALLGDIVRRYPDRYKEIAHKLATLGWQAAQRTGDGSFGINHLRKSPVSRQIQAELRQKISALLDDDRLDDNTRNEAIIKLVGDRAEEHRKKIYDEQVAAGNPLAMQVKSGSRGNPMNLAGILGSDLLYVDHRDHVIPVPVLRSYSEGLQPWEYWSGAFGARKGVLDLKLATRDAGYLGKQLNQVTHRLVVEDLDEEETDEERPLRGVPVDTDDNDNEGALLARDAGPYKRNTPLTPKILKHLQSLQIKRILVRSPITSNAAHGGVFARDVGVREYGVLPGRGELPGMVAAQSLCLDGETLVLMADGTSKAIRCVSPGDWVFGCDKAGTVRPVRVVRRFRNGRKLCHTTTFRLGTGDSSPENLLSVVSTLAHKVLTVQVLGRKVRRPSPEVRPIRRPDNRGIRYYAKLPTGFDDTGMVSEPFALALGLLIGNGCYTGNLKSNGVRLSCYDPSLIADVSAYFVALGCNLVPQSTPGEYRVSSLFKGRYRTDFPLCGVRNPVRRVLLDYGLWGQRSHEKHLPDTSTWDNSSVAHLIAGLIATNGYVSVYRKHKVMVGFGSTSRRLVDEIRRLLWLRFGIYTSAPRKYIKKADGKTYRPRYSIVIAAYANVKKLMELISIPGVKGRKLHSAFAAWPAAAKAAEAGRCSFVSQISAGERETYDIEVDHSDHLFVLANGLVVSNSEPVTQGSISSKHTGGVAGAHAASGFDYINALIQVPKQMGGRATHSERDGVVTRIVAAPAGGHYVHVGDREHYVPEGVDISVEVGDKVEAGDTLSSGIPNPAKVVEHKGVGEGRRYFVKAYRDALKYAGFNGHRRNIELLSRGLINHVRLTDEYGDYVPDDVVQYSSLERIYQPREGARQMAVRDAAAKYLEKPVLHYSIGTPLRPSVIRDLEEFGVKDVWVHDKPPPFKAEMIRGAGSLGFDPDWMTRMYGSGLKAGLLRSAHRGNTSDERGSSFVPSLARGVDFGDPANVVRKPEPGWRVQGVEPIIRDRDYKQAAELFPGVNKSFDAAKPTGASQPKWDIVSGGDGGDNLLGNAGNDNLAGAANQTSTGYSYSDWISNTPGTPSSYRYDIMSGQIIGPGSTPPPVPAPAPAPAPTPPPAPASSRFALSHPAALSPEQLAQMNDASRTMPSGAMAPYQSNSLFRSPAFPAIMTGLSKMGPFGSALGSIGLLAMSDLGAFQTLTRGKDPRLNVDANGNTVPMRMSAQRTIAGANEMATLYPTLFVTQTPSFITGRPTQHGLHPDLLLPENAYLLQHLQTAIDSFHRGEYSEAELKQYLDGIAAKLKTDIDTRNRSVPQARG